MKIEQNIPIPADRATYPFKKMNPGDSVLLEAKPGEDHKTLQGRVSANLSLYRKRHPGVEMISRTVEGGIRVWRTA